VTQTGRMVRPVPVPAATPTQHQEIGVGLPAGARPVELSAELRFYALIGDYRAEPLSLGTRDAFGLVTAELTPTADAIAEAQKKLALAIAACNPAPPARIAVWCGPLLDVLRFGPPDKVSTQRFVAAVLLICGDLPAGCWTRETLAQAFKTFTRSAPTPGEIAALLQPHADRFIKVRDGLIRIADWRAPVRARTDPKDHGDAARAYVRALVQGLTGRPPRA
jgi:hypothetical protein